MGKMKRGTDTHKSLGHGSQGHWCAEPNMRRRVEYGEIGGEGGRRGSELIDWRKHKIGHPARSTGGGGAEEKKKALTLEPFRGSLSAS